MTTPTAGAGRPVPRWALGVLACLAPAVICFYSPARADTALLYIGLLPSFVALTLGPRLALLTALATTAVVFVGLLLSPTHWAAALFMAALALMVAASHLRGWQVAATYVASQAAVAVISAPRTSLLSAADHPASSLGSASLVALFVLASGLWVAMTGSLLLSDLTRPHEEAIPNRTDLINFAIALVISLGVGTLLILEWASSSNAWWILLTALVVLDPEFADTRSRALERAGGTILGGTLAALVVVLIPSRGLISAFGLTAAIGSAVAYLRAPYWVFTSSLTVALVTLTLPLGRALRGDLERVLFTLLAAVLVVAVSALVQNAQTRYQKSAATRRRPTRTQ